MGYGRGGGDLAVDHGLFRIGHIYVLVPGVVLIDPGGIRDDLDPPRAGEGRRDGDVGGRKNQGVIGDDLVARGRGGDFGDLHRAAALVHGRQRVRVTGVVERHPETDCGPRRGCFRFAVLIGRAGDPDLTGGICVVTRIVVAGSAGLAVEGGEHGRSELVPHEGGGDGDAGGRHGEYRAIDSHRITVGVRYSHRVQAVHGCRRVVDGHQIPRAGAGQGRNGAALLGLDHVDAAGHGNVAPRQVRIEPDVNVAGLTGCDRMLVICT